LAQVALLRFQVTSRGYGAASTRIRGRLGWIKKDSGKDGPPAIGVIEEEESGFVKVRRRSWARLIRKVWIEEVCPRCGQRMAVLAAISSPAQDEVIKKILKARGEWNPPWARKRPARGPPAGAATGQGRPPGDTRIEYDEGYDPRREDWEVDREYEDGPSGE
jgi:hypothetical protein